MINLSKQGLVLLVCNMIVFIMIVANIFVSKKSNWVMSLFLLCVLIIPIMAIQVYSLNCMVTGDCRLWSWTLVAFVIVFTLLYIIGFLSMIVKMKQDPVTTKESKEHD